jgi:hypothetical protein
MPRTVPNIDLCIKPTAARYTSETLTVLDGEGAYEGLTAIVDVVADEGACAADLRGVIVEGIPVREPYAPE